MERQEQFVELAPHSPVTTKGLRKLHLKRSLRNLKEFLISLNQKCRCSYFQGFFMPPT
jgi:hypothetical protein